jgi:type VI secretion system protein ImpM
VTGTAVTEVGFYGKLPTHGDFLRRRVSDRFVGVWDRWLQEGIAASREQLGDRWLSVYLTSPAWRFVAAAGVLDRDAIIGLMIPSVDRVGRYFPLTIAAPLPAHIGVITAATAADEFLDRAEQLAVETVTADRIDFDSFDAGVTGLAFELESFTAAPRIVLDPEAAGVLRGAGGRWRVGLGESRQLTPMFDQLLGTHLGTVYDPLVIWWTEGSENVEPSCLIGKGLPGADDFTALMDGAWQLRGWSVAGGRLEGAPPAEEMFDDAIMVDPTPPRFQSFGASNVGKVRSINQDSYLERTDVGLWVVADGMGGHSNGEVASRMVCDGLADFVPTASFEEMIEAASGRLRAVNGQLVRESERADVRSGSTVVALMARGSRYAVVWAGDSRAYHYTAGRLEQVTRDHSAGDVDESGRVSTAITRAVGAEPTLDLDTIRGRVTAGDRFLLCSDGLTRTLSDDEIQRWLELPDAQASVEGLLQATLDAGAPDNVTVVVVEAYS